MNEFIATETELTVDVTQDSADAPFSITVTCRQTDWHTDGRSHTTEEVVGKHTADVALPVVFGVVNDWLLAKFEVAVIPRSWKSSDSQGRNLAIQGRAIPARIVTEDTTDSDESDTTITTIPVTAQSSPQRKR